MATAPKKTTTARKKRAPRKKAPVFEPYVPLPGEKPMLTPENQEFFTDWYNSLPATHQGTVRVLLSMFVNMPLLSDGYKKQATFYRRFLVDRPAEVTF